MEDRGWDPFAESRNMLNDLNQLMQIMLPQEKFPDGEKTIWQLGLLLYSHLFDEFYNSKLRNAVQHSDFIFTDEEFRSRSGISGKEALHSPMKSLIP